MSFRSRLTAATLLAATTFGLIAGAAGAPAGAEEVPVPDSKAASKTFSFAGFSGNSPYSTETFQAPGTTPIIGQFGGSPAVDILWYTPGNGGDQMWTTLGGVDFTESAVSISGSYTPHVGTFATIDGRDDILWYSANGPSQLWDYNVNGTVTKSSLATVTGPGKILIGDFALDGIDDVIRYQAGAGSDSWWDFQQAQIQPRAFAVNGTFTPLVGNFASDASEDILWYAPGAAKDPLWDFDGGGAKTQWDLSINGTYTPVVGGFTSDGKDDVLWYKAGSSPDSIWDFYGVGYETKQLSVNGTYSPVACDCLQAGSLTEDVVWFGPGGAGDAAWKTNGDPFTYSTYAPNMFGASVAGQGEFLASGQELLLIRH